MILENESWKLRMRNYDMMVFGGKKWKQLMKCSGWLWQEFSHSKTIMRGWHKIELWIFKRTDQDLGEILLRSSNVENDDENHHELLRHSRTMKNRNVEPTMKMFWKRSWRRNMTDDNSFLRQTLTRNLRIYPGNKKSQVRSRGKDLWVRAHSKETPLNDLKDRLRRLN